MAKRKAKRARMAKPRPKAERAPALTIGGISEKAAREVTKGILAIIKAGKNQPGLTLEAVRTFASMAKAPDHVTVTNCMFRQGSS
jgi:hypothetical protein